MKEVNKLLFRAVTTEGEGEAFCFLAADWTEAVRKAEEHCKESTTGYLDSLTILDDFVE